MVERESFLSMLQLSNIAGEHLPNYGILFKCDDRVSSNERSASREEFADTRIFNDHMNKAAS